jgi:carbon monoxide dehydrogenase subunit G
MPTFILIVSAIIAILVYAATRPDTFRVERSASFKTTPDKVFAQINDFHNWAAWSTWESMDPTMSKSYGGAANGVGANYAWQGNNKVGQGSMEITESIPNSKVMIKLDFFSPMEAHNIGEFTIQPDGDGTRLTWAMYGPAPFISKLFGVFVNMDKMIGKDFEASLSNLRTVVEK